MGKLIILLTIFLVFSSVYGLEPDERAYFDAQSQKQVAQISAKIDTQTARIEQNLKQEVEKQKNAIRDELAVEIKNDLRGISVGVMGMVIIALAVFKIIDFKLTHTRRIKKYEEELEQKNKEFDEVIAKQKKELDIYRDSLVKFAQQIPNSQAIPVPMPSSASKKKSRFSFLKLSKKWLLIPIVLIIILILISLYIQYPNIFPPANATT